MKPTEPDIKWCIEHEGWLNALWQEKEQEEGDRFIATVAYEEVQGDDWPCVDVNVGEVSVVHGACRIDDNGKPPWDVGVWIPTCDDVLDILASANCVHLDFGDAFYAVAMPDEEDIQAALTPLTALLELAKLTWRPV